MSKRRFKITGIDSVLLVFDLWDILKTPEPEFLKGTELLYTILEEIDFILDMKEGEVKFFYEDRAKNFPCLIKRLK